MFMVTKFVDIFDTYFFTNSWWVNIVIIFMVTKFVNIFDSSILQIPDESTL